MIDAAWSYDPASFVFYYITPDGAQAIVAGNHRIAAKKAAATKFEKIAAFDTSALAPDLRLAVVKLASTIPAMKVLEASASAFGLFF